MKQPLTIQLDGIDHDDLDDVDTDLLFEALASQVNVLLDEFGIHAESTNFIEGHHYASIDHACPDCGACVRWTDLDYCENGAVAEARCTDHDGCGFRGYANFRLIDYELAPYGEPSVVESGRVTPNYHQYPTLADYDTDD